MLDAEDNAEDEADGADHDVCIAEERVAAYF